MADPTATTPVFGVPTGAAPRAPAKYVEQDKKHKGVAGTARDILGTLGDFLLTKLGMPAMYAPAQKQRKLAAAQEGYTDDPLTTIEKVTSVDPVFGAKLRDQYIDNERLKAAQESTAESRAARLASAQQAQDQRTRGYAASMLNSMTEWDDKKRVEYYPKMREQVLNAAKKQGLDLSSELPESFDSVALDAFIDGPVGVAVQRTQKLTREKIQSQEKQADARIKTTVRGQDIRSSDTRRGQDINSADRAAGRAAADARNAARINSRSSPKTRAAKPTAADLQYLRANPAARDKFDGRFGVGMAKRVLGN